MSKGPLAVRYGDWTLHDVQAGALSQVQVELENVGSVAWSDKIRIAYHWLDENGNAIEWDGRRSPLPPVEPGQSAVVNASVRGPIPPGRYRLGLDLVAEYRAWFSALGSPMATRDYDVRPREGTPHAELPSWVEPATDWHERAAAAHAEGYGVVAGAIVWAGRPVHRRPKALRPYEPGPGRVPGFASPLLCPSVLDGLELERLPDVAGLPAYAPPSFDYAVPGQERWIYDGRIQLKVGSSR